jgi:N-acetylglutamate synthase-like GNAT family acetyltransferase
MTGTMLVRDARVEDIASIAAIHEAMGLDYRMPNLESPLFLIQKVVETDGKIIAASALKVEAETYLWVAPELSAREKVDAMYQMQPQMVAEAWEKGIDQIVCWVPETVEKKFAKRLRAMGFSRDRDGWHSWSRETTPDGR